MSKRLNELSCVALAVSGGSDSMAMLHWFINNYKGNYYVVNVEHGIRGEESLRDSRFVKEYCDKRGVKILQYQVDAPAFAKENGYTLEQAARILRGRIFEEQYALGAIVATAHHKADRAESIFMHLARGSGIKGLVGMQAEEGIFIRPLLDVPKYTITEYLKDNGVEYEEDGTNADIRYSRNYVRRVIMPDIKKIYPSFDGSLIKLGERAGELMEYIYSVLPEVAVKDGAASININGMHKALAGEQIRRAIAVMGVEKDIEARHIALIIQLNSARNGSELHLPYALRCIKQGEELVIARTERESAEEYPLEEGEYSYGYGSYEISIGGSGEGKQLDRDKIPFGAVVRTKRAGDKIKLNYGTKSVGNFMTDRKIPKHLRPLIPLIAKDSQVYAIADMAIAESVKATDATKEIINVIFKEN